MPFKYIDEKDAPPAPPKAGTGRAKEFIDLVENLPKGKMAEITPDEGQSLRGIKVSIGRIASKRGLKVQTYDDGQRVYVKRITE